MGTLATEKKAKYMGGGAWDNNGTPTKLCTHDRAKNTFHCIVKPTYRATQLVMTHEIYSRTQTQSCSGTYRLACYCHGNCGKISNGADKNCKRNVNTSYPYYYYETNPSTGITDYYPVCSSNGSTGSTNYYRGCTCYTGISMNLTNGTRCPVYANYGTNCGANKNSNGTNCNKQCSNYCPCDNGGITWSPQPGKSGNGNYKCHCDYDGGSGTMSCTCNYVCARNCPSDSSNTCACNSHSASKL